MVQVRPWTKINKEMQKYKVKRISADIKSIQKIYKIKKVIFGDQANNQKTYRTRKLWSIKRSPHVFSKSQESFGYEVYTGNIDIKNKVENNWPINIKEIFNSIMHVVPGIFWTFKSK